MSQWNEEFQGNQPSTSNQGQVFFYDPTKFQKGVSNFQPVSSTAQQTHADSSTQQNNVDSIGATGFNSNDQVANTATSNSWNTWGAWDSTSTTYNSSEQTNTADTPAVRDSSAYNQQWYGHNQWDSNQMVWDQNTHQWIPNQLCYQQGDPNLQQGQINYHQGQVNQFDGYDQNWSGENISNGQNNVNYNTNYQAVDPSNSIAQVGQFAPNYNAEFSQSSVETVQLINTGDPESVNALEDTDDHTEDNTDELYESETTEATTETESSDNQSLNRSLGNYEEGNLDGYGHSEELVHENEGDTTANCGGSNFVENYSNNGAAMSAQEHQRLDLSSQMQAVSLQENIKVEHVPSKRTCSTEQTNMYTNDPSLYQYQQPGSAPIVTDTSSLNQLQQTEGLITTENTEPVSAFSDWEIVPPQTTVSVSSALDEPLVTSSDPKILTAPYHSRNTSIDENVHFFIGSNASSTRVSPAQSTKPDDKGVRVSTRSGVSNSSGQCEDLPVSNMAPSGIQDFVQGEPPLPSEKVICATITSNSYAPPEPSQSLPKGSSSNPPSDVPPPSAQSGQPSLMSGNSKGGQPHRKSPLTDLNADSSMLSSTRLDVTKSNYENSPGLLNQSISPIPPEKENETKSDQSPQMIGSKSDSSAIITPRSIASKKSSGIPESPILPRKESLFQPPGRNKPLRASHDIRFQNNTEQKAQNVQSNKNSEKQRKALDKSEKDSDRHNTDRDSCRRNDARRTPDREYRRIDYEGRKTPDLDRRREDRKYGRRTPDRESRDERYSTENDREHTRSNRSNGDNTDRLTSRPPRPSNGNDRGPPPRSHQSAFHQIQTHQSKNNVSPAASLWDTPDNLSTVSNILLVPQSSMSTCTPVSQSGTAPAVLTPVASLITSLSEHIKNDDNNDSNKRQNKTESRQYLTKDAKERDTDYRCKDKDLDDPDLRGNKSYESLRAKDRTFKDSRTNSREKLSMYSSRNSLDEDDPRDRTRRGDSRERSYRDKDYYSDRNRDKDRDRPPSRTGSTVDGYSRRDYRDRDSYRDREYYSRKNDRDRPRSRQGGDRPASRQGDRERPRSRGGEYERDAEEHRSRGGGYDRDSSHYRDKNKSGYDYDDYYRRGAHHYDRQYYDYYYGNYSQGGYYDEQGYYHSDPRYHHDYHQRRSRTGTPGSLSDGGEEISKIAEKSKKSDKNADKKRFDYPPELHDYSQHRGQYGDYYGYYEYDQSQYRWDPHISQWVTNTATEVEPQRQTPEKFMYPHVRASFGPNGQLVKVLPNGPAEGQPATIEIHDVQTLLEDNDESEELKAFPGPLVRGDTHKNDVLLFCQEKAQQCAENMQLEDRDSAQLVWRFLELLIKQNGTIVGTDIADLLLKGHEPTTLEYKRTGMKIAASLDNLDVDEEGSEGRLSRGTTPIDRSMINRGRSVDDVTDRFRHLLLYGRKKDAIDWAMKNQLWGHALFLASKMDTRMHANVLTRFANVAMRMNDPLQTLYQLMSGRQPAAVTSVGEERWGDWRPHLAMILSNHSTKLDLDRKSITQLGDTLASRGFLHASHFCYLMSRISFGSYNKKSSKIVLVGSSHSQPLELFANNEAIQCTEIYEYALALGNTVVSLANFQYFKYLYCSRLVDYGLVQEALQYCEEISKHINNNPVNYQHVLVKLIYDMSCQLKFADPHIQESGDEDIPDPDWMRALHTTLVQFEEGAIQCVSGSVTPAYLGTAASSESGEVGMIMQGTDTSAGYSQDLHVSGTLNKQDTQHYQGNMAGDQSQYMSQYGQEQYSYQQGFGEVSQYNSSIGTHGGHVEQPTIHSTEQSQTDTQQVQVNSMYQQYGSTNHQQENAGSNNYTTDPDLQWPEQNIQQMENHMGYGSANQHQDTNSATQNAFNHQGQTSQSTGHFQPYDGNLGESQASTRTVDTHRSSLTSTSSYSQQDDDEVQDTVDGGYTGHDIFDLQPTQQKIVAPALRKRTVSESSNGSASGTGRHMRETSSEKQDNMSLSKPKQNNGGSGGIWGKIGGLFSRNKNEMKLPDDKEPTIVWDPVEKKWIDKDADEADSTPTAPPPKDTDLLGLSPTMSIGFTAPSSNMPPPAPPGANKYSRKKGLGTRGSYVDVLNPKPVSNQQVPTDLFSPLPSVHSAPAIFNPSGNYDASSSVTGSQTTESIAEEKSIAGDHKVTSSHSRGGLSFPPPSENLSRASSKSSLSKEIQQILGKNEPSGPMQTSLPTMFNPAQFQNNQAVKGPAGGTGHRLSNRRVYPK